MRGIVYDKCPLGGEEGCFYCSITKVTRPYTRIEKDPKTRMFKPVGLGRKTIELGEYCNNACAPVATLHYCPSRWERMKKGGYYGKAKS